MTAEITKIDYEILVADYLRSLTTVLRGFKTGSGYAFLETWVHDDNENRGILGIIEAARDYGLPGISISIGQATLQKLDFPLLREQAAQQGKIFVEHSPLGMDLTTHFFEADSAEKKDHSAQQNKVFKTSAQRERAHYAPPDSVAVDALVDREALYANGLKLLSKRSGHEGSLEAEAPLQHAQHTSAGAVLEVLVDPNHHVIRKVAYHGKISDLQRTLLEGLSTIIENKPLIEACQHGVIYLEFELRDHSAVAPVRGIVTPENAHPMFGFLVQLSQGILADYRRSTGFDSTRNYFDQPVSENWKALDQTEKENRIRAALVQHPAGRGVELVRMESQKRVVVGFLEELGGREKQSRLFQLEDFLKNRLEPTLQIYVEPKVDLNKLRRLKEASAI